MFKRLIKLSKSHSFFLFGARGTGKSTLLDQLFSKTDIMMINLLDPEEEANYSKTPSLMVERWQSLNPKPKWIVIDEVQKNPKLLDLVHLCIEKYKINFALTGSSARKLKRGAANLLAGRAFTFNLHPLNFIELDKVFKLDQVLQYGTLPKIFSLKNDSDKKKYLKSYAYTYLKEEIQLEQVVRKVEPFRRFLEVAAQSNGEILNYSKLAREAGVEAKSVERYFEILSDTLIGFYLNAYHTSVRKQQALKPKFYFFDLGVCRAIKGHLDLPVQPKTIAYGKAFEHFIVLECIRLNDYFEKDFRFYYLRTKDDAEIDLIIERPGKKIILIEIKSTNNVDPVDIMKLVKLSAGFTNPQLMIFSQEKTSRLQNGVLILNWKDGLEKIFIKDK